jgi:hypothetical protein
MTTSLSRFGDIVSGLLRAWLPAKKKYEVGRAVIYGADEKWLKAPITNLPWNTAGVRVRLRNNRVATAAVKTRDGAVTKYILVPDGDFSTGKMKLGWPVGSNTGVPADLK